MGWSLSSSRRQKDSQVLIPAKSLNHCKALHRSLSSWTSSSPSENSHTHRSSLKTNAVSQINTVPKKKQKKTCYLKKKSKYQEANAFSFQVILFSHSLSSAFCFYTRSYIDTHTHKKLVSKKRDQICFFPDILRKVTLLTFSASASSKTAECWEDPSHNRADRFPRLDSSSWQRHMTRT